VALVRIEQLYPFPTQAYEAVLHRYSNARDVVWCQEEPQNQGAWYQIRHRLEDALQKDRQQLLYAGRGHAAAPATGMAKLHETEQRELVEAALHAATRSVKREASRSVPSAAESPALRKSS
jgi:2-oxoglutarate dehydrogenase E1 component